MGLDSFLKREFRLELLKRGPAASAAFFMLGTWMLYENYSSFAASYPYLLTTATIYACCLARVWICLYGLKSNGEIGLPLELAHGFSIILNGLGFGLFFSWSLLDYKYPARESLEAMSILAGTVAGSPITLAAAPLLLAGYIFTSVGLPLATIGYLLNTGRYTEPPTSLAGIILILVIYVSLQSRHARQLLRKSIIGSYLLLEDKERLQSVIDSVPGFVICLDRDGRLSAVSRGFSDKIGQDYSVGRPLYALKDPLGELIDGFYRAGTKANAQEIQIHYRNESSWHLVSLTRIESAAHSAIAIGVSIDELVKVRQELNVQTAKALYSSKLASLGEMAGGIAHEVNNPLMIVQASLDEILVLINKPTPPTPEVLATTLQRGLKAINRVAKIISSLLHFSRQADDDPMEITSLQGIVDETLELCRARFKSANIELVVQPGPDAMVRCRPTQISQVLLNLLNNAFDAAAESPGSKSVTIAHAQSDRTVQIHVTNSGTRISDDVAARMFEPFFTTKPPGQGTGLGLSISQGIILSHGGRIYMDPSVPETRISIELPVVS